MRKIFAFLLAFILIASLASPAAIAKSFKYGDVNGDGKVNSSDALEAFAFLTGKKDLSADAKKAADVDNNGEIDSNDVLLFLQFSTRSIDYFPVEATPDGSSIAEIVSFYNTAANAAKAYKGKMELNISQGTVSKIVESTFADAQIAIANGMLPNDYPVFKTFTVINGNGNGRNETKGVNETRNIKKILPIDDNEKMSTLTADGVKSATRTRVEGGYRVVITLKEETINKLGARPKHHSSCMGILEVTEDDLRPLKIDKLDVNYSGGVITAVIDDKNRLVEFDAVDPMRISMTLRWMHIFNTVVIETCYKQNVKFTY